MNRLSDEQVTYHEVGATRDASSLPVGYRHDVYSVKVGYLDGVRGTSSGKR